MNKLEHLQDFITTKDIEKSKLFEQLKCTKNEALLLRKMTIDHIESNADQAVFELLVAVYGKEEYKYIHHLGEIKSLIDQGWISLNSFHHIKTSELSLLDLLSFTVSLSSSFLKLLEDGNLDFVLPDIVPYADQLEYLQEEFLKVDLYRKLAQIRQNHDQNSPNYKRVKTRLSMLEKQINERIKVTKEMPKLKKYFKEMALNEKEQLIFLALLKEEYSGTDESLRDMNVLIELISLDDYEKIKNRALLEDTAPLIEKAIIDYDEMFTPFGGISRAFYIDEELLKEIIHQKKQKPQKIEIDTLIKEQEIFELISPKTSLKDVVLNPETKEMLDSVLKQIDKTVATRLKEWGIKNKKASINAKIIFHGQPGTGKTLTALSMAKSLKREIISFDCSKILSMYVGESEKNVRKIFDSYKEIVEKTKKEPILLLNEADQFLSSRTSGTGSGAEKMHNQMQNIFLEQIERFEGVLIATTNLLENIDPAFSRRFDHKVKFDRPNEKQRLEIWKKLMPKKAPLDEKLNLEDLAKFSLSGGQIDLVIKNTAMVVATQKNPLFTYEAFNKIIQKELSGAFGDEKTVGFVL